MAETSIKAWLLDQVHRSLFFHEKLHEWRMVEVYDVLKQLPAWEWEWNLEHLDISEQAWNKVIHAGLKPVLVFAHPEALRQYPETVMYYRTLAMLSQKAMGRTLQRVEKYERGKSVPSPEEALSFAQHFNRIISLLIEDDERVREEELWLWRGMGAGTQAQGAWQNEKGARAERQLRLWLAERVAMLGWQQVSEIEWERGEVSLRFGAEPDICVLRRSSKSKQEEVLAGVEVKGGIDAAGVLERIGAAVKTFQRIKDQWPSAITLLVLSRASVTQTAQAEIHRQRFAINELFFLEELLEQKEELNETQQRFLRQMRVL